MYYILYGLIKRINSVLFFWMFPPCCVGPLLSGQKSEEEIVWVFGRLGVRLFLLGT